jgi:AsmA protein
MRKLFKVLTILFGVVLALIAVLIIVLMVVVDPNRYRDDIVKAVKTETGRDLKIDGKLKLSLFPWLGLETGRLSLSNAPGFGNEPMARVESAGVRVALMPLFRKRVMVDGVRLNGLKLHLARAADGRSNWDDLTKASKTPAAKPTPAPADKKGAGNGAQALSMFTVRHIEVQNSEFTWRDASAGSSYSFKNVALTSGNLLGAKPAPVHLAFDFESGQPKVAKRVTLDASANFDPANDVLNLPSLKLALGDLKLNGQLRGTDVLKAPKLTGKIDVPAFNLRALLRELNIAYVPADDKVLTKVALAAQVQSGPQALDISNLKLTLDDTQLTGSAGIQHKPRASYRAELAVDDIDIDRYLPKAEPEPKAGGKKAPARGAAPAVIPIALLRDTEADAALRVQKLKAFGIRSQQVEVKFTAHAGRVSIGPSTAKLYDGSYAGRTIVDVTGKTPKYQFEEKLTGVQIGPFLKDVGVFDNYTGSGNVDIQLTALGLDANQITASLNGKAALALRDGKIQGVNLQKLIQDARALYEKARGRETRPTTQASDETAFKSLTATINVANGVARNTDLKLEGPVVRAQGAGQADLVQQKLEYKLQVTVAEAANRAGTTVPVRIGGSFEKPEYGVDFSAMVKQEAKQQVEQEKKKAKKKAKEKLLDRLLK